MTGVQTCALPIYAGARFVTAGHSFRTYDWNEATTMVDSLMASYSLESELNGVKH